MASTYMPFKAPAMAIACQRSTKDDASPIVVAAGGGGKAKTGISNKIAVYKVVEHATVKLPVLERVKENDTGDVMMSDMAMSPDGALVASGPIEGAECTIFAVDRTDNTLHELIKFPTDFSAEEPQQKAVAFNDDGSLLATGGKDGVVRVWKVKWASGDADKATRVSSVTVTLAHKLSGHTKPVCSVGFHYTSSLLVSASEDDTCLLWDLKTTKQCQKLPGGFGEAAQAGTGGSVERRAKVFGEWWYSAVAFMPDGDTIFAMERSKRGPAVVSKFSLPEKAKWTDDKIAPAVRTVTVNKTVASCMAVSPDGRFVGVGTSGGDVKVVSTKQLSTVMIKKEVHTFPVTSATFMPFGKDMLIVTASMDKCLAVTPVRPNGWAKVKPLLPLLLLLLSAAWLLYKFVLRPRSTGAADQEL